MTAAAGRGAYVFDFDGTLFDVGAYLPGPADQDNPAAWDRFFTTAQAAPPIGWVHDALRQAAAAGHPCVVLTARDAARRAVTEAMLAAHHLPVTEVVMRAHGPWETDTVVKEALLADVLARYGTIVRVYDDRPSVIRMWRAHGLDVVVVPTWPAEVPD